MNNKEKSISHYLELAARIYVFIMLNMYGLGKIVGGQFYRKGALPPKVAEQTLGNVNSYDLAWTFMGHSYTYILFIGISQIIGAWCLLWDRTKFIGIAILIPILSNIIVFDAVFFNTNDYGALGSAVIYFSLLMLVLFINKEKLIDILQLMTSGTNNKTSSSFKEKSISVLIALSIVALFFGIDQFFVKLLGQQTYY